VIQRGIDRGQLPGHVDPDAVADELVVAIFVRLLVVGRSVDLACAQRHVQRMLAQACC